MPETCIEFREEKTTLTSFGEENLRNYLLHWVTYWQAKLSGIDPRDDALDELVEEALIEVWLSTDRGIRHYFIDEIIVRTPPDRPHLLIHLSNNTVDSAFETSMIHSVHTCICYTVADQQFTVTQGYVEMVTDDYMEDMNIVKSMLAV